MKRAQYSQRGPVPQAFIEAVDFEPPTLQSGQVLIQVLAAPINPSDVLTLTGAYGKLPPLPAVGGNEGVGKVVKLGPDVTAPAVGQTVLLPVGCGTWATHVVGEAKRLMPLPGNLALVEAIQKHGELVFGETIPAMGTPLYTDVRLYAEHGIPGVIYGAGPRTVLESNAKRADERLALSDLHGATRVIARTLLDLLMPHHAA